MENSPVRCAMLLLVMELHRCAWQLYKLMSDTIGDDQLVLTGHKGRYDFYSVHKEARFQSATARGFVKSQTVRDPLVHTQWVLPHRHVS